MEGLIERYRKLPDIDSCKISTLYSHNKRVKKDGTPWEQVQERQFVRKKPYTQFKKFLKDLIDAMPNDEFSDFYKSIDWEQYMET